MAEATKVPVAYLAKILQKLARKGIIQTQRGVGGGVSLAKPAADLTYEEAAALAEARRQPRVNGIPAGASGARTPG